jgi:phage terminase large subunit GpA-like protein
MRAVKGAGQNRDQRVFGLDQGNDLRGGRRLVVDAHDDGAGMALVLGHRVIWGKYNAEETWAELDGLIGARFPHSLGGKIGVDACAIDAGDGVSMHHVTAFATPRTRRKVLAIKGAPGNRPMIERAGSKTKAGARLWIVGVDSVKMTFFGRLAQARNVRFSVELPPVFFEQLASERSVVRYSRGQPLRSFIRIPERRVEALDCVVYAVAARAVVNLDYDQRRPDLSTEAAPAPKRAPVLVSSWMERR